MYFGSVDEHMKLTRGVTRAMGLSLSEKMPAAHLDPQDFAALITRCRGCNCVVECREWIDTQERRALTTPANCPNQTIFVKLASR